MRLLRERDMDILEQLQNNTDGLTVEELALRIKDDNLATQLSIQQLKKKDLVFTNLITRRITIAKPGFMIRHVKCPYCQTEKRIQNTQPATHCANRNCRKPNGETRQYWVVKQYDYQHGKLIPKNIA